MRNSILLAITSIILFICSAGEAFAQTEYEDVVYLKNGGVVHGMIIEQVPNVSIKIQTKDRNVFVYKMEEVEKITKEVVPKVARGSGSSEGAFKERGYLNITEIVVAPGLGDFNEELSYGIQTINGALISPSVSLGVGIGVDKYKYVTLMPITADLRAYFTQTATTGFFDAAIGYSVAFDKELGGGLILNPSIGVRFTVSPKAAISIGIGYRRQDLRAEYTIYNGFGFSTFTSTATAELLSFRMGVSF